MHTTYEFPDCMHALSAALRLNNVDPEAVTISLPFDEWQRLYSALERKFRGLTAYDAAQPGGVSFKYMGFRFVPERPR